jgi:O-antigen/teichoic acid export membrane protein
MAFMVLRTGGYFAQVGTASAIVQKEVLSKTDIRAAFTSSVILGLFFAIATFLLAPLGEWVFKSNDIVGVLQVMSLYFVLNGFSTTSVGLLRREFRFRSLAIVETVSYFIGYAAVGVTLALAGFGVWSLVVASLCQAGITAVLAFLYTRHSLRLLFSWDDYKPLLSFGSKVSIVSFMEFISGNLDTMVIGRFFGPSKLGYYNRAFTLMNQPVYYLTSSVSRVLFPAFSRMSGDEQRSKKGYLSIMFALFLLLSVVCMGACFAARDVVLVVLGAKWVESIILLQILAPAALFVYLSSIGAMVCEATANLSPRIAIQIIHICLLALLMILLGEYGTVGIAVSVLLGELFRHLAYLVVMAKLFSIRIREFLSFHLPGVYAVALIGCAFMGLTATMNSTDASPFVSLLIKIIIALLVLVIVALWPGSMVRSQLTQIFKEMISPNSNSRLYPRIYLWLSRA